MTKYKVKAGIHVDGSKVYKAGEEFTSSCDTLCDTFQNKFEVISVDDQPKPPESVSAREEGVGGNANPPPTPPSADSKPAKKSKGPQGKDKTSKFKKALENDYLVYLDEGRFFVYDKDDIAEPINSQGVNREDVDRVIEEALED